MLWRNAVIGAFSLVVGLVCILLAGGWSPVRGQHQNSLSEAGTDEWTESAAEKVAASVLAYRQKNVVMVQDGGAKGSALAAKSRGSASGSAAAGKFTPQSLLAWASAGQSLAIVKGAVNLILRGGEGSTSSKGAEARLKALELASGSKGFDAGRGVQEPDAERSPEDTLGDLMGDQETCWEHVEAFCKKHLGSDADQLKACILSVCIVHADIE